MNLTKQFLSAEHFAVAGASRDRSKYGNIVFRKLLDSGRVVYPINPTVTNVEDHAAFANLSALPVVPESVSIVTPPSVTREIVREAIEVGVKNLWMQPGAEDVVASDLARKAGLNVIDDGSCLLVVLAMTR